MNQPVPTKLLREYCFKRYGKSRLSPWLRWSLPKRLKGFMCRQANVTGPKKECDVLILQPDKKLSGAERNKKLVDRLKLAGLKTEDVFELNEDEVFAQGAICPPFVHDSLFRLNEGYTNFLKKKYQPKVIVTQKIGLNLPFLKSRNPSDPITIHLPHYVLNDHLRKNSLMDVDYYALYGSSSLEYLKLMKLKFGACKFLLGGSFLFDESFNLPDSSPKEPILLLGMGPRLEKNLLA